MLSRFQIAIEENLITQRYSVDQHILRISSRRAECIPYDAVHAETEALIEAQIGDIGGCRRDNQPMSAADAAAIDRSFDQATPDTLALMSFIDGHALEFEHAGTVGLEDLEMTRRQIALSCDQYLSETDIACDLLRRVIGKRKKVRQCLAVSGEAFNRHGLISRQWASGRRLSVAVSADLSALLAAALQWHKSKRDETGMDWAIASLSKQIPQRYRWPMPPQGPSAGNMWARTEAAHRLVIQCFSDCVTTGRLLRSSSGRHPLPLENASWR